VLINVLRSLSQEASLKLRPALWNFKIEEAQTLAQVCRSGLCGWVLVPEVKKGDSMITILKHKYAELQ
jgi:hypothetical protein